MYGAQASILEKTCPNSKHLREMVAVISTVLTGLHSWDYEIRLTFAFRFDLSLFFFILPMHYLLELSHTDNNDDYLFVFWVCVYVGLIQT